MENAAAQAGPVLRQRLSGEPVDEDDHELLMLLGSVSIRVGEIITGLLEDSLSCDEQLAFEKQLKELAEGFHKRVMRTPLVIDLEAT